MLALLFTESSFTVSFRSVELLDMGIKVEFAWVYHSLFYDVKTRYSSALKTKHIIQD
jgi:hypothetical protein